MLRTSCWWFAGRCCTIDERSICKLAPERQVILRVITIFVVAASLSVGLAGLAFAQTSGQEGYGSVGGVVVGTNNTPPAGPSGSEPQAVSQSGSAPVRPLAVSNTFSHNEAQGALPFTGAELGVMAAVALALIGSGLAVRRLSTRSAEA